MQAHSKTQIPRPRQKLVFSIISNLVIQQKLSLFYEYLHFICSELQYIAILLFIQTSLLTYDKTNALSIFAIKLSQVLAFRDFIQAESLILILSGCMVAVWIYFGCIVLLVCYIFYKAVKYQDLHEKVQIWISILFQFHAGFLFWIVNMILMTVISLNLNGARFPKISSQEGKDNAIIGTQFVFVIFNYGIGMIGALFSFDPFCFTNLFAVRTCSFQLLGFLLKAIFAPIVAFTSYDNIYSKVILIIIAFAISLTRAVDIAANLPFYNYWPMKLTRIITTINAWLSFSNILAMIWQENGLTTSLNLTYLNVFMIPLAIKYSLGTYHRFLEFFIKSNSANIQSERQIYGKLFAYRFLADKINLSLNENKVIDKYEAYFLGDLKNHSQGCEDLNCLCVSMRMNEKKNTESSVEHAKKSLSTYLSIISISFLGETLFRAEKNKNQLKLILAEMIFTKTTHRFSCALRYVFQTFNERVDLLTKVKRYLLNEKIQASLLQYSSQTNDGKLDIVKFVDYEHDTTDFLSEIASTTNEYVNFWDNMKNPKFKMTDLLTKSDQIEKTADRIDKLWNSLNEKHEPFYHQMKDPYRVYLSIVRNTPSVSSSEIKKLRWKNKPRDFGKISQIMNDEFSSSKVLSFYMSMMRERLGKITYVSENIQNCLGYSSQDIVGRSINIIMPPIFAEKHDQVLLKHLERSQTNSQISDHFTWAIYVKTKAGYIVPCSIYITIFPYLQQELVYTGIVKVLTTKFDFILTDNRGIIDSFTAGVGKKLGLSLEKKINIKEICFDIDQLLSKSQKKSWKTSIHKSGAFVSNAVYDTREDPNNTDEEVKSKSAVLAFLKRKESIKYVKYNTTLTEREILDKTVYIFQMELAHNNKHSLRTPRSFRKEVELDKELDFKEDDIMEEIPREGLPVSPKMHWKKTFNEEIMLSDSKDEFTETNSLTQRPLKQQMSGRKTWRQSEWTESNFGKKTASRIITGSQSNGQNLINSIDIEDGRSQNHRGGSSPSRMSPRKVAGFEKSEIGSTTSMSSNMNNKLETAVYMIPKNKSNYLMKVIIWGLMMIAITLNLVFLENAKGNLDFLYDDVSVMTTSTMRLYQITELNKRTRMMSLYMYGYVDDTRFQSFQGMNFPILIIGIVYIGYIYPNITIYNNMIRTSLQKIEPSLQEELFTSTTPIYEPDSKKIANNVSIFDAATALSIQAGEFALLNPFLIRSDNYQMNFILNNTLNEQLVVSAQVNDALLEDNEIKLESLKDQALWFLIILLLLSVLILSLYGYNQFKFIQGRNKVIDLLLVLSDEEINKNINPVRVFKNIVLKKGVNIEEEMSKGASMSQNQSANKGFHLRRRDTDLKGINYRILFGTILFLSITAAAFVPFIIILATISKHKEIIRKNIVTIVDSNNNLCDMDLLSTAIYEYIQWNSTTTIKAMPINQEMEASFVSLTASQQVFLDLYADNKDDNGNVIDPDLDLLLSGNVCQAVGIEPSICTYFGAMTDKGILGLNTFALVTLRSVKASFDASSRSFYDGKTALSQADLITLEGVYTIVQESIFKKLGDILRVRAEQKIQNLSDSLKIIAIVSSIWCVLVGVVVARVVYKLAEKERIRWRKMLRKIPFNIVLNNKGFKNYLVKESNHLLDSMKNVF